MLLFNNIEFLNTGIAGLYIARKNGVVSLEYNGPHNSSQENIIFTLPLGYRPLTNQRIAIYPTEKTLTLIVYVNGKVVLDSLPGGPTFVNGGLSFVCEQYI